MKHNRYYQTDRTSALIRNKRIMLAGLPKLTVLALGVVSIITAQPTMADQSDTTAKPSAQLEIHQLLQSAKDLISGAEPEKAEFALKKAMTLNAQEEPGYRTRVRLHNTNEIKQEFQALRDLLSVNALIRCASFLDTAGAKSEALSYYRRATKLEPDNTDTWAKLANCCARQKRYLEASTAYDKAGIEIGDRPHFLIGNKAWGRSQVGDFRPRSKRAAIEQNPKNEP